ncbi:uncharacterized protein LOC132196521 [Neocloeon triangulifer]|uniref:uncharacterized protein LOC132196521 n=1 Tax=Neocloeon triangulifer TaxID=2078957 RepID=UPI00286F2375|nr:uncharacterized protein LOC132196521 [Neocloeon triangulifer]XP_059475223.1 uncharacterized protein LOC132196521 [Neocloeon triangulifer]
MPSQDKVQKKLQLLLTKFMVQDHQVIDDTCLEKLLTQLSKEECGSQLLQLQECQGFGECALQAFEKGVVGESVLSFALRLHSLVIKDEKTFSIPALQESTKNIACAPRWMVTNNASLQFSFVQMVSALLYHNTGVEWLKNSGVWKTVKKLFENNSSIYVARECQKFLVSMVLKTFEVEMEFSKQILQGPLDTLSSNKTDLTSSANLLINVLEEALKENKSRDISEIIRPQLSKICSDYLGVSNTESSVLVKIANLDLLLQFCAVETSVASVSTLEESSLMLISKLVSLKDITAVQTITGQCQIYWKFLKPRIEHLLGKCNYDVQIVYIQILPIMKNKNDDINMQDAVKNFLEKLCCCTSALTQEVGCCFRKLCFNQSTHQKIACRSIQSLMQLKEVLDRSTSVYIFRALMCIVVQLVSCDSAEIVEIQDSGLMRTTLEALIKMMDHFHFTWTESFETVEILTHMQDLLCISALKDRQVSPILQIMRRAVEDFLPPNLALLTNTLEGSTLQNLGPQLYKCMHSISWEVRDSALEVVTVIAKISVDKFPAFQEHLVQHNLASLAVAMALGDEDSYVRNSALKCITTMVAVPYYWERCLKDQKLLGLMMKILCQETEGVVRYPATSLANAMLLNDRLKAEEKEQLYSVMAAAAVGDLHWEVKVGTLQFWETSINQQLMTQGMIDGHFPEVTFSSSSRRIITLNEREIRNRLQHVLNELARIKCLAVLMSTLYDPDLHVVKKSAEITKQLLKHLDEHGLLIKENSIGELAAADLGEIEDDILDTILQDLDTPMENSKSVIDGIVDASDLSLLSSVCRTQLSLSENEPVPCAPPPVSMVAADEFLKAAATMDVDQIIASKEDWLHHTQDHLESLLTDMLEAREFTHNTNDMDCY